MSAPYRQFCPVAKAMELLDERWTMLIVRELISGSSQFNELRRGVPRISPALLSKRLGELTRAGIVAKDQAGARAGYRLTEAGRELEPVVEAIGTWGIRWIGELGDADLDPRLLLWDIHRNLRHENLPAGRTVVEFTFPDCAASQRHWWLVATPDDADVCDADPGHPVSVTVTASLRELTRVWRGDLPWDRALRSGSVALSGNGPLCRQFPGWLALSTFADVRRPHSPRGAEVTASAAAGTPAPPR